MPGEKRAQNWSYIQSRARSHDDDDERREWDWASEERQRELKARIEAQDIPVRERIIEVEDAFEASLDRKRMVLFQGETGSGKSVYSPIAARRVLTKRDMRDRTVMMQPRRDAASGIARAVAAVSNARLGRDVGFSTSETRAIRGDTAVNVVTPGIFLRYLMNGDLTREHVGALIIDELHEGSIDYHLALGLIKMMQDRDEHPLTILTSATLNKERILEFFELDEQDYLRIEGRTHPVDVRYRAEQTETSERATGKPELRYIAQAAEEARQMCESETAGDILVFMPGAREITECVNLIGQIPGVDVLPLHGTLGPDDRDKALRGKPSNGAKRRVIVSTNIAETSVTIPGITIVVDSCRQRSVRYNPKTGIIEMGTEFISKDQAEQRAGRAGRVQPGEAVRLLSEDAFMRLAEHPESEIAKTNLSHLLLRLKRLGIDPEHFPFIEPPKPEAIRLGLQELQQLGALDEKGSLTDLGVEMGELPFEPRVGRMIVEAKKRKCLEPALVLAAFSREQNVLLGATRRDEEEAEGSSPEEKRLNARKKVQKIQDRFDRGESDWLKVLNVFVEAIDNGVFEASDRMRTPEHRRKQHMFEAWCKEYYIKPEALRHIAYRLHDYARYAGIRLDRSTLKDTMTSANDADIGSVILSGHPDLLLYAGGHGYIPTYYKLDHRASAEINMSPGSEGWDARPNLCIASMISQGKGRGRRGAEIVRNYASGVHPITLHQLREVMPHLIEQSVRSSGYNTATDQVERTIELHPKGAPSVLLGKESEKVTGPQAVELFASALIRGDIYLPCVAENRGVLQRLEKLYPRSAGRVTVPELKTWYQERLGTAHTHADAERLGDRLLMDFEEFCPPELQNDLEQHFPETLAVGGNDVMVTYAYRRTEQKFQARLTMPLEIIWELTDEQIPAIGTPDRRPELIFETLYSYSSTPALTLDALKEKEDAKRLDKKWTGWSDKPQPVAVTPEYDVPLPTPESFGIHPRAYATNYKGEPAVAYPAVTAKYASPNSLRYGKSEYAFFIEFSQTKALAEKNERGAQEIKTQADERERKEKEKIERTRGLNERLEQYRSRLGVIRNSPNDYGYPADDYTFTSCEYDLARAEENIRWEHFDDVPVYLDKVQRILDAADGWKKERNELFPDILALHQRVQPLVSEKLAMESYERYGLPYELWNRYCDIWTQANAFVTGRKHRGEKILPSKAKEFLEELERVLPALELQKETPKPYESTPAPWNAPPKSRESSSAGIAVFGKAPGSLAEKIQAAMEANKQKPPEDEKSGEETPPPGPTEQETPEKIEHAREEEPLTDEGRREMEKSIAAVEAMMKSVRALGSRPSTSQTKREQALTDLHNAVRDAGKILADSRRELETPNARPARLRSTLGSARAALLSKMNRCMPLVLEGYDKTWSGAFQKLLDDAPNHIHASGDAQEFIREGLITEADLLQKVREEIERRIPDMQRGQSVLFQHILDKTLADI